MATHHPVRHTFRCTIATLALATALLLDPTSAWAQDELRTLSLSSLRAAGEPAGEIGPLAHACDFFAQSPSRTDATLPAALATPVKAVEAPQGARFTRLPAQATGQAIDLWTLGACANLYERHVESLGNTPPDRADALRAHYALTRVKKHLRRIEDAATGRDESIVTARALVDEALTRVERKMRGQDMLNRVSAAVFAGAPLGPTARRLSGAAGAARVAEGREQSVMTTVVVETPHWGWPGESAADVGLRLRFGTQSTTALVAIPASDASSEEIVMTSAGGLLASLSVRAGRPFQRVNGELSFFATAGTHSLDDVAATFNADTETPTTAVLVDNGAGRWAGFLEAGLEFTLFDNPVRVLHAEQGLVTPAITIGLAIRRDERLTVPTAADPALWRGSRDRLVARFMVDAIKALRRRDVGADAQSYDFGFGVEHDRALGGSKILPPITRFIIRGDVNLNLLKPPSSGSQ